MPRRTQIFESDFPPPHTSQSYKRVLLKCQNMNFERARTNEATTKSSDGARASYFRTGSSEKRRHCARARTPWTFFRGIWDTPLPEVSSSPPPGLCAPSARRQTQREREILLFFSFLFVTNRLGRDDIAGERDYLLLLCCTFSTPPTDLPISQTQTRARENLTNNLIFLLQLVQIKPTVFEHRESRQRVRPDSTTF